MAFIHNHLLAPSDITIENTSPLYDIYKVGDFMGFALNGIHSSTLGIVRTSEGDRYEIGLTPEVEDKTVRVPGGDNTYLFGSYYPQKPFNMPIAFDGMTELQLNQLRVLIANKKPMSLIFDEAPYKAYYVKVQNIPTIKYLAFNETINGNEVRLYKGEGTLSFVAYQAYAKGLWKTTADAGYPTDTITYKNPAGQNVVVPTNRAEWAAASRIPATNCVKNGNEYSLTNYGDVDMDTMIYINFKNDHSMPAFDLRYKINSDSTTYTALKFSAFTAEQVNGNYDAKIRINTKLHLIEGVDSNNNITGTVYNQYKTAGDFFQIPPSTLYKLSTSGSTQNISSIDYSYQYY